MGIESVKIKKIEKSNDCIFCKIVKGELPCEKVFENKDFLAFLDIKPVVEGHTLLIPKKHFNTIMDLDKDTSQKYIEVIKEVARIIIKKYNAEGFNCSVNNGKVAGQIINHVHFHILPRKRREEKNKKELPLF
ncbi:MAG: HIT family protein [Candidatus Pacearchaeota archaeon]